MKKSHSIETPVKPCSAFIRRQQDELHCSRCGRTWDLADKDEIECDFIKKQEGAKSE